MKTSNKIILTSAFALGLAGAAAGALADNGSEPDEGFGRMGHMCEHRDETRIDMMEAYMESRLELTEAQMPAWNNAVETVRDAMAAKQAACDAAKDQGRPENTLEALDRAEQHMEAGLEQVKAIRAAVGDLYNVLDAEQQATFDSMLKDMRHMRG
jgi:hypothetical protein